MKKNHLAMLSPLCLGLLAGNAHAALEPFSFGASENLQHQSNIGHSLDEQRVADWISTTEFNAALNQAIGRDALVATAAVDFNRYKRTHALNSTGYQGAAQFDWSTVGDLSGSFGADTQRRQYIAGESTEIPGSTGTTAHNLQTDRHAFARVTLGGESRWSISGGADANDRRFSNSTFDASDERQWSGNLGTRYASSPDLSFGLNGTYVHGEYPHAQTSATTQGVARFSTRSFNLNSKWQASGNSALQASVGYTSEDNQALANARHFVNGSLNWAWTPPSHFTVNVGLRRSSDADASTAATNVGVVNANNLNGTSVNNVGHLEVVYALTAKTSLDASADYTQRRYADVRVLNGAVTSVVNGDTRTLRLFLSAHFQPTRTTDLGCGGGRETRHADSALSVPKFANSYTDNYLQCSASIKFD
jgi:hypothetical protein